MRAERNREAQRAGAGQQRGDIHTHFRKQDHDSNGANDHRQRVAKQRQQRSGAGAGQRAAVNIRCQTVFNQAGEQRPANRREEQDQRDADQHIHRFLPAAVMHPLPKIEQAPRAEQQHNRHANR